MGPQLYRCGNQYWIQGILTNHVMLQWGRNFIVAEIAMRDRGSHASRYSFNGAATLSLRKFDAVRLYRRLMAVLQWGRNFIVAEITQHLLQCSISSMASMGPQLYRCGNADVPHHRPAPAWSLQWGRNFIVAEIFQHPNPLLHHPHASMGPQLYRCGNRSTAAATYGGDTRFNGAATLSLRKSEYTFTPSTTRVWLQWGRNFIVAEIQPLL